MLGLIRFLYLLNVIERLGSYLCYLELEGQFNFLTEKLLSPGYEETPDWPLRNVSSFHRGTTELKLHSTRATRRSFLPTTVCAYLCFSLCKPWDGTLYIDLRSLRARREDWIFIKQFSNYKSFLCLLVKNFRNYFN